MGVDEGRDQVLGQFSKVRIEYDTGDRIECKGQRVGSPGKPRRNDVPRRLPTGRPLERATVTSVHASVVPDRRNLNVHTTGCGAERLAKRVRPLS